MTIDRLMKGRLKPALMVEEDQSLEHALKLILRHDIPALVVIKDGIPTYSFTPKDLVFLFAGSWKQVNDLRVRDVARCPLFTAGPGDDAEITINRMIQARAEHLFILMEDDRMQIATLFDLASAYIGALRDEISHLKGYIDDMHDAFID